MGMHLRGKSSLQAAPMGPTFSAPAHQLQYNRLCTWLIGESLEIDWDVLHDVGIVDEV